MYNKIPAEKRGFLHIEKNLRLLLEVAEGVRTVMNDSPVDCQNREVTEPQREAVTK